jgi:hypothetical protein
MSTARISSSITVEISASGVGVCRLLVPCVATGLRYDPGSADGQEARNLLCTCKSSICVEAGVR